jgi:hypothetical protein
MQVWGLSPALFQFLFSIFRQRRAELACGEVFQGAEASVELGGREAALAVEGAQKIGGGTVALGGWHILDRLRRLRVGTE